MSEHDAAQCRMVMAHYKKMMTEPTPEGEPDIREGAQAIIECFHRFEFATLAKMLIADGWQAETAYACARHMEATRG